MVTHQILVGDVLKRLRELPDESVNCIVTSPPYWGLRDYGVKGQIGLEPTTEAYLRKLVSVFRECRRVLRSDGTCWINMGDCYAGNGSAYGDDKSTLQGRKQSGANGVVRKAKRGKRLKAKDLIGLPWRLALALQEKGWWLRIDIVWSKTNPMPESVEDRPTRSHEYVFLLTKSSKYWYDKNAIAEPASPTGIKRWKKTTRTEPYNLKRSKSNTGQVKAGDSGGLVSPEARRRIATLGTRNARSVWEISTTPYKEAHFAVFPEELPRRCILAGCPEGGVVLDPFAGSGTTGEVALDLGRNVILIELNPEYVPLIEKRLKSVTPGMVFEEAG